MYNPIPSTYLTIAEHQRRLRMEASNTSIILMSHEKPKKPTKKGTRNGN